MSVPDVPDEQDFSPGAVRTAVKAKDDEAALLAIAEALASELDGHECCNCNKNVRPPSSAANAKELRATLAALKAITKAEVSAVDEIAKRRADRLASGVPDAPAEPVERGKRSSRPRGKRGAAS